jgi:hypothetical protein
LNQAHYWLIKQWTIDKDLITVKCTYAKLEQHFTKLYL